MDVRDAQEKVTEFMVRNEFLVGADLESMRHDEEGTQTLAHVREALDPLVSLLKRKAHETDDPRLSRAWLMLEEMAETIESLGLSDENDLADGLADLMYTALGTAATYNIPLWTVFDEVHRSNMTKVRSADDKHLKTCKGLKYEPPNIQEAIIRGRREMDGFEPPIGAEADAQ